MGVIEPVKYISKRYSGRKPSVIRSIVSKSIGVPGLLSLAGGLPNPAVFPFEGLSATLRGGEKLEVPADQVSAALQYSASKGMPKFIEQLKNLQTRFHSPPTPIDLMVGSGSQSLLAQTFDMLLNPGDPLLVEAPTYPGALAALQAVNPSFVPVQTDKQGLVPENLRKTLESWDASSGMKPRVLYTIPTGQNPSGATISAERRPEIYKIAQEHDLVIIEDDPYYYLYLGPEGVTGAEPPKSFLSMDVDGRVIRFDSLSKVLSSGMRLGFVTAQPKFIEMIDLDVQGTSLHTSNVSQVLAATLLEKWGTEGWDAHVASVKSFYAQRRERFTFYLNKHLADLAEWTYPEAGMFVWLRFNNVSDTLDLISKKAAEQKVLLVPGQSFFTDGLPSNTCRASYSLASDDEMDEALRRLAVLIRSEGN